MISYDDLVVALAGWRARQGLSVVQAPGSAPARTPGPPASPARAAAPSPARPAPPGAPPRASAPRAVVAEQDDFEDSALVEDAPYDAVGDDYVMEGVEQAGEATAISGAPEPVDGVLVPKRSKRPDW